MRCLAPHAKLRWSVFFVSYVLVANLPVQLQAAQTQELRLFHEPLDVIEVDTQIIDACQSQADPNESWQSKNLTGVRAPDLKLPATVAEPVDHADPAESVAYQYNGFISTAVGQHFLINGVLLNDIDALEFVSVKQGGKSIELKTSAGRTFELSVGQSITVDLL